MTTVNYTPRTWKREGVESKEAAIAYVRADPSRRYWMRDTEDGPFFIYTVDKEAT